MDSQMAFDRHCDATEAAKFGSQTDRDFQNCVDIIAAKPAKSALP
jgi:hypothetical protein